MKIGAFAKKFGLNASAVRFYINNGLLTPTKKNEQYVFDADCISDMEKILEYKNFRFSLEEMQLLFFLEKASRFQDELVLNVCGEMLESKRQELLEERRSLDDAVIALQEEIEKLPVSVQASKKTRGIPFAFIPYLYCPHCQIPLRLDDASLSGGYLQQGKLHCDCGYRASIEDGLILCQGFDKETPFKAFNNINSVLAMRDQFSTSYRTFISKTYLWMYGQMADQLDSPQHILTGPFTFNFLLKFIDKLGPDHTYIVIDPSLKRIQKIQQYLLDQPYNIIYIAGNPAQLPIKHGSVDLYVDDYSTTNALFTYNDFQTSDIAPLIKRKGKAIGIFTVYKKAPKSLQKFKEAHPNFLPEKMTFGGLRSAWMQGDVHFCETKLMGETETTEKHFPQHVIGEQVSVHGYLAEKK